MPERFQDSKPFSLPTNEKPMSDIRYFLRVMTEKEFRKKYPGTSHWAYKRLCKFDADGFLE